MMKLEKKYLFIDDVRDPIDVYHYTNHSIYLKPWSIVRSYDEFVKYILYHGLPETISFDHDLGFTNEYYIEANLPSPEIDKTGYNCAKWLVDYCIDNKQKLPNYLIHSQNPVGANNIVQLLDNYSKFESSNK